MNKTEKVLFYESAYNVHECITQITKEPHRYTCELGTELWYQTERLSDTQVFITFTGGQFRKMMQTQYLMEFIPRQHNTRIVLRFQKELFGFLPMTSPSDIDRCMKQKLDAVRGSENEAVF